jgi:hypothetical protein
VREQRQKFDAPGIEMSDAEYDCYIKHRCKVVFKETEEEESADTDQGETQDPEVRPNKRQRLD